jgi:hypothetical protein
MRDKQHIGEIMTKIFRLFALVAALLVYHDFMVRVAQQGYVGGYTEGLGDSAVKAAIHSKNCSGEDVLMLIEFMEVRSAMYLDTYEREGGFF